MSRGIFAVSLAALGNQVPRKGSLAICGIGCLGLITKDLIQRVNYPDGNTGMAYIGIHLTDKVCAVGSPWSARKPMVVGHVDDIQKVSP